MSNADLYDYLPVPDAKMPARVARQVAWVGAMCGAVEAIAVARSTHIAHDLVDRAELLAVTVTLGYLLGLVAGWVSGIVAHRRSRSRARWERYRAGFFGGALVCVGYLILPPLVNVMLNGSLVIGLGVLASAGFVAYVAWQNAGYWYHRELMGAAPRLPWWALGALGTLAFGLVAMQGDTPAPPKETPPSTAGNLVLVTIDTLRRDHVGAYGGKVATPVLDGIAARGLLVEDAVTPTPETAPSHASMFTGFSPNQHRVTSNGVQLASRNETLAERLHAAGWATGAFVGSYALDARRGLDQGFDVYDDALAPRGRLALRARVPALGVRLFARFGRPADAPWLLERAAPSTIARALAWVTSVPRERPVFVWVHLFEPHSPYEAPGFDPRVDHRAILAEEPGHDYTDEERAALRDRYAAEVAYADRQLGVLLDGLRAAGRLDRAMTMVLGDHGEALGEHGVDFTHHGLWEDVIRVPMLLEATLAAWAPGAHVTGQVSVQTVADTFLTWSGVPGLTSAPDLNTRAIGVTGDASSILLMGHDGRGRSRGPVDGIRSSELKVLREQGRWTAYDLRGGRAETEDVADKQRAAVSFAEQVLDTLRAEPSLRQDDDGRLEALGYRE